MASTKVDPAKEQESADADDESVFTDSEEDEGELHLGRRDAASDDEGEAEESEIRGDQAASAGAHQDHHTKFPSRPCRNFDVQSTNNDTPWSSARCVMW